jgi:TolB-like protein
MAGIASIGVVAASLVQWRPEATPSLATALPVIAVMPFETRGAIEPDHLGASLAETIITMLSRAPQIMTIVR